MISRLAYLVAVISAISMCCASRLAHAQSDQVFLSKGAPTRGKITDMDRDQVTLEVSGAQRPIPVNEIVRVTFAGEPIELNSARSAAFQKNYTLAAQELRKLEGTQLANDYIKQDAEYYKALCQARLAMTEGGDKTAAMTALLNFVRAAPKSFHFYEAAEVLGDLAQASGKYADAAKYYDPIARATWPDYQMRANNAVGRALTAEKQIDQALERFEKVLSTDLTTPEGNRQKLLATAGKAVCLAEKGKGAEGVALLEDIINKNDSQDTALFARTYNALGKCYLKMNKPKDAVLAFLHTDILFYSEPEAHAEALYHLSKLWTEINKSDRAVTARNTLKERYAGSIWASLE
jgi:tetratricopeptide (TPR) repeat protein